MSTSEERVRILKLVERGGLTPQQAAELLNALDVQEAPAESEAENPAGLPAGEPVSNPGPAPEAENVPPESVHVVDPEPPPAKFKRWNGWWQIPMWIGVGITVLGALFMYLSVRGGSLNFWFFLSLLPFMLGVALIGLAWTFRAALWLHVRVRRNSGERRENVNISMPLPIGLASWGLNMAGRFSPEFRENHYADVLSMVNQASHTDPIHIEVDEKNGDKVEIFIG